MSSHGKQLDPRIWNDLVDLVPKYREMHSRKQAEDCVDETWKGLKEKYPKEKYPKLAEELRSVEYRKVRSHSSL